MLDSGMVAIVLALFIAPAPGGHAASTLDSPNGRLHVETDVPNWSVSYDGHKLFDGNRLGLILHGDGDLLSNAKFTSASYRNCDRKVKVLFGRASTAVDRYNELWLSLEGKTGRRFEIVFRCYDDAVAVRYQVSKTKDETEIVVQDERTIFRPAGTPTAFVQYLSSYTTSHEHAVDVTTFREVKSDVLLDTPLTLQFPTATAAITEAALRRYAGMGLHKTGDALISDLTPRPDGSKVVVKDHLLTPWRVILIGDQPGRLLESNTLYCLNEASAISDTRWIHPGKMTWPWWNGNVVKDGKPTPPIFSLEAQRLYIDFAAASGIQYHSTIANNTDTPWYHQNNQGVVPGPTTDVTRARDDLDLQAIKLYADSKGVRLWTWVHSRALRGRVDEAFTAFEKMGWAGMMVDFFDHDDQDTVELAEHILVAAANHHILIHFHGIWKPTGLQRTFPNLMNHEGALNQEYMKWSDRVTPSHTLKLLYTRMVAGPMDYHSGGFRAVRKEDFKVQFVAPLVEGTRAFMLASYVCFDNPNPMVADSPGAYQDQPGFEVLSEVPTYWDETRVVLAEIGKLVVTARRKGKEWWIAGMSAGPARTIELPLSAFGPMNHRATLWLDDATPGADPNRIKKQNVTLGSLQNLRVDLAEDGGFVAHFRR